MLTIKTIIAQTYANWSEAVKAKVGDNYSIENSATVSKMPYASLFFPGVSGDAYDLEGGEGTVIPSVQIDIYTNGQKALTSAYEIDELSHAAMLKMRYRRTTGPEFVQSTDPSIKRLTSRYSRVIGFGDSLTAQDGTG